MNGATFSELIMMPLRAPATHPVKRQQTKATWIGPPCKRTHANTVADRLTAVPTDRSIPPEIMTTVIPSAAITTGADEISIACRFRSDRNCPPSG
jgi:hypothetical protein